MSRRRRERLAMEKAIMNALKNGWGSCVLSDGTAIVVTRDEPGLSTMGPFYLTFPDLLGLPKSTGHHSRLT